ncbi:hypothetical protein [Rhizobium laguerreae]|uniref:Uncharacterized protein n=1 Tax=Rhizobium laguerreae TaxID=1076926 RepID=A0AAX2QSP9_9HYPH|nr:hypothetical protein [Rhizobium laguerreae]TCU29929.1 hypothetical protein EV131_101415 [Rhizobium laguerreae]
MAEGQIISKALGALLDIMTSDKVKEAQCIEAARAIIEYEAPPEVFDLTYKYLIGVAQDEAQDVALKLKALELIRKAEAKRITPGTAKAVDTSAAMALGRAVAMAKRRVELVRGERWPAQDGWTENLGEVRGMVVEEEGVASRLKAARSRACELRH